MSHRHHQRGYDAASYGGGRGDRGGYAPQTQAPPQQSEWVYNEQDGCYYRRNDTAFTQPHYQAEPGVYERVYIESPAGSRTYYRFDDVNQQEPYYRPSRQQPYQRVFAPSTTFPGDFENAREPGVPWFRGSDGHYRRVINIRGIGRMEAAHQQQFRDYLRRNNNSFMNRQGLMVEFTEVNVTEELHNSTAPSDPHSGTNIRHYGVILTNATLRDQGRSHLLHYRPAPNEHYSHFYPAPMDERTKIKKQAERKAAKDRRDRPGPRDPRGGGRGGGAGGGVAGGGRKTTGGKDGRGGGGGRGANIQDQRYQQYRGGRGGSQAAYESGGRGGQVYHDDRRARSPSPNPGYYDRRGRSPSPGPGYYYEDRGPRSPSPMGYMSRSPSPQPMPPRSSGGYGHPGPAMVNGYQVQYSRW
ncbi:hypothetical protein B0H66DRAFT_609971 [Apodospora peruviana]|uniref:Uncharacterized protein n=1 Tax=Apodospora peruviana TaxID=516989 RepID=A0AAE0MEH2_9PEZI|nr:hypothetical protein B0H66DRAFT_609971 [Apodospora peruviana]